MLRVGYDLTGLELDAGGTARTALGLAEELDQRADVELVRLRQPGAAAVRGRAGRIARGLLRELAWYPFELPRRAERAGVDVLHCPFPLAPRFRGAVPVVITVHDLLALDRPEWFTRANAAHTRLIVGGAARAASVVVTQSAYSRERLVARLGLDGDRVVVASPGVDQRFGPGPGPGDALRARIGVGDAPYVLTVGTLQPRKNVAGAISSVERLAASGAPHHLVVVGAAGWRDTPLEERVARSRVADRIHVAGRLGDDDLVRLYRGAACLLFLSLGEGWGLPPAEAMACGTPVVSSDRTSLPEVVGDAGLLADPDDDAAVDAALRAVLDDPARADELRQRGLARAAELSWARCADRVVEAYRRASG